MSAARSFAAVVIGVSTGGVEALKRLLPALPADFALPILVVIHISANSGDALARLLDAHTRIRVKEADEGERIEAGVAYLAPPDYHLLVEPDGRLALAADALVNFARPSVDVLFESAARRYGRELVAVVLTGAGADGAAGLACVARMGGYTVVQDPRDALMDAMPSAALAQCRPDRVLALAGLAELLIALANGEVAA
ncbi:MAG: chemotaxis protein CheB [Pseudomonadota bacterium]